MVIQLLNDGGCDKLLFFMVTVDGKLDGGRLDGGNGCFGKGIAADSIGIVGDEGLACTVE